MKIAIASGKGGTGKTTFSTNFAYFLSKKGKAVTFLDCDVEEPNAHIFFHPHWNIKNDVSLLTPSIDKTLCTNCGLCAQSCQFRAITNLGVDTMIFQELCHGCGLCSLICPEKAISEVPRTIGTVESGKSDNIHFIQGTLKIGEPLATPIIKKVREYDTTDDIVIIDSPPGTACATIASVYDTDLVVLVTEPTPFGLNDLILAVEMTRALNLPSVVVINQADYGERKVWDYCSDEGIDIVMEIPHVRKIAELYSRGFLFISHMPHYENLFEEMFNKIKNKVEI